MSGSYVGGGGGGGEEGGRVLGLEEENGLWLSTQQITADPVDKYYGNP